MAFGFWQSLICCYRPIQVEERLDETTHLIPHIIEPPVTHPNDRLYDHQQIQARLGDIVRAKEGKMVNVASHIPFNLHNRVIPVEKSMSPSVSRSPSQSADYDEPYHPSHTYFDVYSNRNSARKRKRHPFIGHRDLSPNGSWTVAGPSNIARSRSPITIEPRPTPILNVRLVGYTDVTTRGRTTERGSLQSPTKDSKSPPMSSTESAEGDNDASKRRSSTADFQVYDIGPIIISWGD
ncbi:hypothetical protein BDN70DRAFT_881975 [Pholiota conissans]|uniref:Uncharacterized protein n=1 Tax=Pholiota conissans TaxID=109636 RepID=A0A9P6CXQ0_9AGAR|nr:hypothetical protein BDN70DRAFT_881975 [Pholiota conissans]